MTTSRVGSSVELGVGGAAAGLERVPLDDVGLGEGGQRAVDRLTCEAFGVVGDRDVLGSELVLHDEPRRHPGDGEDRAGDDDEDRQDADGTGGGAGVGRGRHAQHSW
jgi:hypothetical protein